MTRHMSRVAFGLVTVFMVALAIVLSACGETATTAPAPAVGGVLASSTAAAATVANNSTAPSGTSVATRSTTSVGNTTATAVPGSASAAPTDDPCKILTATEIKNALDLSGTVAMQPSASSSRGCSYFYSASATSGVTELGGLRLLLDINADSFGVYAADGATVSGLGDKAAYSDPDNLIVVQKGNAIISIGFVVGAKTISADIARSASRGLAATAIARLPTTAAVPIAATSASAATDPSCTILAKADIEAVLGLKLADPQPQYGGCLYYQARTTATNTMPYISIVVRKGINRPEVDKAITTLAGTEKIVAVSGIGDSAQAFSNFLFAFKGDAYVSLQPGSNAVTLAQVKQLATKALPKL